MMLRRRRDAKRLPSGFVLTCVVLVGQTALGYVMDGWLGALALLWLGAMFVYAAGEVGFEVGQLQGWHDGYDEATDKLTDWAKEQITPEAMRAAAAVAIRRMMEQREQEWRDLSAVKDPELN